MNRGRAILAAALVAGAGTVTTAAGQTILLELQALGLTSPTSVTHAGDGSGRLFVTEQAGRIEIFDGTQLLPTAFLDLTTKVSCCFERGLFSVAFHPNYSSNGFFYVNYTDNNGDTVVERYSVSGNPNVADPTSGLLILAVDQPFPNHNGGQLQFGPNDGYLYIGMGDGGNPGDADNNGQSINTLLGKILRIDVDSGSPYAIPPDNPYVGIAGDDEIWAIGFRNPWRFSFDRLTGDLFIGDVGEQAFEEVNYQPASSDGCENYGWRRMEANTCFNPATNCSPGLPTGCNPTGALELPILDYAHQNNPCDSVTGGYRYRGTGVPGIAGMYIYADYCRGEIWGAVPSSTEGGATAWQETLLFDAPFFLSSFGEDEDGELYVVEIGPGGKIYKIVGAPELTLAVSGTCPGPVTVTLSNAPPQTEVGVVPAANTNGFVKGGTLCNGAAFEIGEPFQLPPRWIFADANGNASAQMTLQPNRCFVQALAPATCELSNTVQVPQD